MRIELDPEEVREAVKAHAQSLVAFDGTVLAGGFASADQVVLHQGGSATVTFISYPGDEIEDIDTSDMSELPTVKEAETKAKKTAAKGNG